MFEKLVAIDIYFKAAQEHIRLRKVQTQKNRWGVETDLCHTIAIPGSDSSGGAPNKARGRQKTSARILPEAPLSSRLARFSLGDQRESLYIHQTVFVYPDSEV